MRSTRRSIPSFSLYGEQPRAAGHIDGVHIEDIQSRSRKYLWKIGSHRHAQLSQCVFVAMGPVIVTLDEARTELAGPALMIIPAGTVHSFRFRPETQGHVLTVDLDRLLGVATAAHQSPIEVLFSRARVIDLRTDLILAARAQPLFERLGQEFRQPESSLAPVGSWLACSVLWILASAAATAIAAEPHTSAETDRLRRFRLLIETYYLRHRPVQHYARRLGVSETSLNRLCRRLTGSTAFDLLQQRLALEARRRLVYTASSVSGIGAELGFKDPAYFSRFFRRHSAINPNEFRRRHGGG